MKKRANVITTESYCKANNYRQNLCATRYNISRCILRSSSTN